MNWFLVWLFLHITAAVIAFGPIFVFPMTALLAQKRPDHLPFAMELDHWVGSRLVVPVGLTMPISGVAMLIAANIDLLKTTYLLVAITLYVIAMTLAIGLQLRGGTRLVELTNPMPPTGPTPETVALMARARNVGMLLTALFFVIIFLMIIKPGGVVAGPLFG